MAVIEATSVSVESGGVTLLAPTSVSVAAGEALIVRGANGTGKSTFLRVMSSALRPSSGEARVAGVPVPDRSRAQRRRVATMIGLPPMAADLTVHDHVALVASTWYDDQADAGAATREALRSLDLTGLHGRFPHELSSGQTQLFGLALVLVRPFDVLVLDEPEQRLDPQRLGLVAEALTRRRSAGATLIIATHSDALEDRLADRKLDLGTPT
ncbi:ABC-type multidrug transport system ATPase subunit [Clavibacter michiganensis]|uniref:ABC transporter ATP-binding protein n=1 Tax=Clavibacter michiganensis TaxID=28447 RepID=UPI001D431483|nr:ATP-binding cassette domain-containing protein [Clavibacter michiganensis]MBM7412526.1 ABC-type multidrug transport system ATPase subunit [Clavibacter michiganensis]